MKKVAGHHRGVPYWRESIGERVLVTWYVGKNKFGQLMTDSCIHEQAKKWIEDSQLRLGYRAGRAKRETQSYLKSAGIEFR